MGTKLGTIAKRRLETKISNRRIYLKCKRKFGRGEWIRPTDLLVPNQTSGVLHWVAPACGSSLQLFFCRDFSDFERFRFVPACSRLGIFVARKGQEKGKAELATRLIIGYYWATKAILIC